MHLRSLPSYARRTIHFETLVTEAFRCFVSQSIKQEPTMQWNKPTFNEMRFGFEVTMYINNR
jgi:coenzyme PQQ precursor peptide PqqA